MRFELSHSLGRKRSELLSPQSATRHSSVAGSRLAPPHVHTRNLPAGIFWRARHPSGVSAVRFTYPNGQSIDSVAPEHVHPFTDWKAVTEANAAVGIHINERTGVTRWAGEPMDYGLAVEVLLQQEKRPRKVPAGTSGVSEGGGMLI